MKVFKCKYYGGWCRWLPLRGLAAALVLTLLATSARVVSAAGPSHSSREILDPCLGSRWQFRIDPAHPERPSRLVLIDSSALASSVASPVPIIAIHAGDRITVEQQSGVLQARLQAVAIESAIAGQVLRVRLVAGRAAPPSTGVVLRVQAISPGRGRWLAVERIAQ